MSEPKEHVIIWQSPINNTDPRYIKEIAQQWSKKAIGKLEENLKQGGIANPEAYHIIIRGVYSWLPVFTDTLERTILGRAIKGDEVTPASNLAFPPNQRDFKIRVKGSSDLLLERLPPFYSDRLLKSSILNLYEDFCETVFKASHSRFHSQGHAR